MCGLVGVGVGVGGEGAGDGGWQAAAYCMESHLRSMHAGTNCAEAGEAASSHGGTAAAGTHQRPTVSRK